jgi:ribose transport system substrate-binding protein
MSSAALKIVVSLHVASSVYQQAEARAAQVAAQQYGFRVNVIYADGDAVTQSEQLLKLIYSSGEARPDVIILEPIGTGMVRVAQEAAKAGVGWIVLNREVAYVAELRGSSRAPMFAVTTDHVESGRIQGRQLNALLPRGGTVVYLQGPSGHPVVQARTEGMMETKDPRINVRRLQGHWQESEASAAMTSWLRLPTSGELRPLVVAAQNDFMAMGARKAVGQVAGQASQEGPAKIRYIGCDGLEEHGRRWTYGGLLDATIICPPLSALAIEMLAKELQKGVPAPALTLAEPVSFPKLSQLRPA